MCMHIYIYITRKVRRASAITEASMISLFMAISIAVSGEPEGSEFVMLIVGIARPNSKPRIVGRLHLPARDRPDSERGN